MKKLLLLTTIVLMLTSVFAFAIYNEDNCMSPINATTSNAIFLDETEANVDTDSTTITIDVNAEESADSDWLIPTSTSIIVSIIVMVVTAISLIAKHNSANKKISATNYVSKNGYQVYDRKENYVRTYETVQHNFYKQNNK